MPARGFHFTEQGGKKISRREFNQLARAYGLPARSFWQITKGESGHMPFVQQHDPGDGMVGYGLFQLTPNAWGKGTAAMRKFEQLGGVAGMRDVRNQFEMARFLYKSAGNSFKPWYGTRYLTDRSEEGQLGPKRPGLAGGVNLGGGRKGGRTDRRLQMGNIASAEEVAQALQTRQAPPVSGPSAPEFAAKLALPGGYQPPESGGGPARRPSLTDALAQLDTAGPTNAQVIGGRKINAGGGGGGGGGRPRTQGEIHELFWNGPGARNIDEGKRVGKGFVSGHTDHVHLAADRTTMKRAARKAKGLGLYVGEYGPGVTSGHAPNSFHYRPYGAMDVSGSTAAMKKFARLVAQGRI